MDFSWLTSALSDPNIIQGMGNAGQVLQQGGTFGEAFNPADMIRNMQQQKATKLLLDNMLGDGDLQSGGATGIEKILSGLISPVADTKTPTTNLTDNFGVAGNILPTPKGSPGPDAVTTTRTADGTVTTIKEPSARNLSTYGTSVPPESVRGGSRSTVPFWQTLLG